MALCFHSLFNGIAIGVAETEADAWKALWTISLHKIFAAIATGIALLRMILNRPLLSCAAYAFAFAISSPTGVWFMIGIIIDAVTQGPVADWIFAISMGLASSSWDVLLFELNYPLPENVSYWFIFLSVPLYHHRFSIGQLWNWTANKNHAISFFSQSWNSFLHQVGQLWILSPESKLVLNFFLLWVPESSPSMWRSSLTIPLQWQDTETLSLC